MPQNYTHEMGFPRNITKRPLNILPCSNAYVIICPSFKKDVIQNVPFFFMKFFALVV